MHLSLSDLVTHLNQAGVAASLHQSDAVQDATIRGVTTDSRSVGDGQLFVPLLAERDGHDFLLGALKAGASASLTSRSSDGWTGAELAAAHPDKTVIQVADTDRALSEIGRFARSKHDGPVVGITGSVGKTSAKDLTLAACAATLNTWASEKSFNNEIGVPLTLANAPDDTEVMVVEMGARGVGHIADLCAIAKPTIGVVTTVAMAHSALFGSIEAIAQAKGELIEALPADGTAVLNADNPLVAAMADRCSGRVQTFGYADGADLRVVDVELNEWLQPRFGLVYQRERFDLRLQVAGAHMASNAAAAVCAAMAAGVEITDAIAGVASGALSPMRMEVSTAASGALVINDAYNANPTSMRAALAALVRLEAASKTAVVGLMAELGSEGSAEHVAIAEEMTAAGVRVLAVDAADYGEAAEHVESIEQAHQELRALGPGDAVLIKGSRVAALERLASALLG